MREREEQLAHQRNMERMHEQELQLQLEYQRLEQQRAQQGPDQTQYNNGPVSSSYMSAPPPPERNSSYDIYSKAGIVPPNAGGGVYDSGLYGAGEPPRSSSASALRQPDNTNLYASGKKTVSFDSNLTTEYRDTRRYTSTTSTSSETSLYSNQDPSAAPYGQYPAGSGSISSPTDPEPFQRQYRPAPPATTTSHTSTTLLTNDVFDSTSMRTPDNTYDPRLAVGSTPGVVGTQEIYRDPRDRIAAQRTNGQNAKNPGPERMSFRDKMKMFAHEIGDGTPQDRAKISSAEYRIENGQPY